MATTVSRPASVLDRFPSNTRRAMAPPPAIPPYQPKALQRREQEQPFAPPPPPKDDVPLSRQNSKTAPTTPPKVIRDSHRKTTFTRTGFLGEGGFARVYEVADVNGNRLAIKVVTKSSLKTKKSKTKLYAEIKLHRSLHHPNIVNFIDCFEDLENVYMTLELCHNGSMMDMLRRRRRFSEPEARFYLVQIIGACSNMHANNVIHRDLKLGNLFLDDKMNIKVGDFGLAALIETPGERKKTICGTPNYIAPEVLFDTANGHSFEVDTWSIGVILYTLVVGKPPFQTREVKEIYQRIRDNAYEFPTERQLSSAVQHLISQILELDPQLRPSLDEILEHQFFTQGLIPSHMPRYALDHTPSWPDLTIHQSRHNLARLRRQCLIDTDVSVLSSSVNTSNAGSRTAAQQERDFHRAVQPGSPLSVLLTSAKQPLVVAGGGIGASPHRPVGGLYKKLAAAATGSADTSISSTSTRGLGNMRSPARGGGLATLVELDEEAAAAKEAKDLRNRTRELESQKARIVAQMAPEEGEEVEVVDDEDTVEQVQVENVPPQPKLQSRSKVASSPPKEIIPLKAPPPIGAERRAREVLKPQSSISASSSSYQRVTEPPKAQLPSLPTTSSIISAASSSRALPSSSSMASSSSHAMPSSTSSSLAPSSSRTQPSSSKLAGISTSSSSKAYTSTSRKDSEAPTSTSGRLEVLTSAMASTKISSSARSGSIPNINCPPPPNPPVMLKVHGFDETAKSLAEAFDALDDGLVYRSGVPQEEIVFAKVFIVSWVDYCNKYGMGYALTDGSIGVHFNDSTTMVLAPEKRTVDYISNRRSGMAAVRKNYTVDDSDFPEEQKTKLYLLRHFEAYMAERLHGEHSFCWEDKERRRGMDMVQKYFRMKNVIVFKLSNDVIQFNFYDHTKLILSSKGLGITYLDKQYEMSNQTLSEVMKTAFKMERTKREDKLLNKLKYAREVLESIQMVSSNATAAALNARQQQLDLAERQRAPRV